MNLHNISFSGKTGIITGAAQGIGKAIAVRFIKAGAKVMITGRNEEKLKAVAEEIGSPDLYYNVFDITDINFKAAFSLCVTRLTIWNQGV